MERRPSIEFRPRDQLVKDPRNARTHTPEQTEMIANSIRRFGWTSPMLVDDVIRAGNCRYDAAGLIYDAGEDIYLAPGKERGGQKIPFGTVPVLDCTGWTDEEREAYGLADNQLALLAGWDVGQLRESLDALSQTDFPLDIIGFDQAALEALAAAGQPPPEKVDRPGLSDEFLIAPFTVLNAREGWWQNRKRQWVGLGIESELGRGDNLIKRSLTDMLASIVPGHVSNAMAFIDECRARDMDDVEIMQTARRRWPGANQGKGIPAGLAFGEFGEWASGASTGTSIFDPVLCELAYRWFAPPGGVVLDPFAGGSVRGIVAAALGRRYVGVELRGEQVAANRAQWPSIKALLGEPPASEEVPPLRVDDIEGFRIVRDDLVVGGTKRRALDRVIASIEADELIYATPAYGFAQIAIAFACRAAGKKATIVVAERKVRHPRTALAASAGAEIVESKAGYLSVVQKRARDLAAERGAYLVPFGMEDEIFVDALADVARDLPGDPPAEIWSVAGSGVLNRALRRAFPDAKLHAVRIGKDPDVAEGTTLHVAPEKFEDDARQPPPFPSCGNYDAKAWRFMVEHASPGALFWNVGADPAATVGGPEPEWHIGDSKVVVPTLDVAADFIFSCPPYGDLEVYSDDPADISNMDPDEFDAAYAAIIAAAVAKLRPDRFACFVVGDYRDKRGMYRNLIGKTVSAFAAAGMSLYNEAILVTSVGSLPIRAAKQFRTSRKLGKTHQNVLTFVKGDPRAAAVACGIVDVSDALAGITPEEDDPAG